MSDNSWLASIFSQPNHYAPASAESVNNMSSEFAKILMAQKLARINNPVNASIADNPGLANSMAQEQYNNVLSQHSRDDQDAADKLIKNDISNQASRDQVHQLDNQAQRSDFDLSADYPFMAQSLDRYPTNGTEEQQAQFKADLSHGRNAETYANLFGGGKGLETYKELLGIQNQTQTNSRDTNGAIIGSFNKRSPYAQVPTDSQNDPSTARAVSDLSKDSESLKAMDTVNQTIAPIFNDIQNLRNFIRDHNGIPRGKGADRDAYEGLTSGLTVKLGRLYGAGQTLRMSPAVLKLIEDTAGNPNGWSARFLWDDKGVQKNLDTLQDGLLSSVPHSYPAYTQFSYDNLAKDIQDPELQKRIRAAGKPINSDNAAKKPTYGGNTGQPKDSVRVTFTGPDGKAEQAYIPKSGLEQAQKKAKAWGGTLSVTGDADA